MAHAVMENWDNPAKTAQRQQFVEFILKHMSRKEIEEAQMVMLPGYDRANRTSLEVKQVADKAGIRRENILGIEKEDKVFQHLKDANLGIRLFHGTYEDFFAQTKEQFDIASIDDSGQFTRSAHDACSNIFGRGLLKQRSILHTTFYGAREPPSTKEVYRTIGMWDLMLGQRTTAENMDILMEHDARAAQSHDLLAIDRDNITKALIVLAVAGPYPVGLKREDVIKDLSNTNVIQAELGLRGLGPLYRYWLLRQVRPYFPEDIVRHSYRGHDGAPMLMDLFRLDRHPEFFDQALYPLTLVPGHGPEVNPNEARLRVGYGGNGEMVVCADANFKVEGVDVKGSGDMRQPPVKRMLAHIGMIMEKLNIDSKPLPRRSLLIAPGRHTLTNKRLKQLIDDGAEPKELEKKFIFNKSRAAAYKAHRTMREKENAKELSRLVRTKEPEESGVTAREEREALSDFFKH